MVRREVKIPRFSVMANENFREMTKTTTALVLKALVGKLDSILSRVLGPTGHQYLNE